MGLFRKSPPPRPALHHRVPRPWDPPETEFPAIVPISTLLFGRSGQTAIAITGMSAYSNGFEIFVTRLIRPDVLGFDEDPVPGSPRDMLTERQSFQLRLQFSDGRMVTSGKAPDASRQGRSCDRVAAAERRIMCSGGGGPGHCRPPGRWSSSPARDRRSPGRHRRATDPRRGSAQYPGMARGQQLITSTRTISLGTGWSWLVDHPIRRSSAGCIVRE